MKTLLVLAALCSTAVITAHKSRESRNLDWLFGGFNIFGPSSTEPIEDLEINVQKNKLQNKILQRRTSQISHDDKNRDLPRARVLNRPPPARVGGPVKGYQPPKRPPPSFQQKPNIAAPVIISSYASTSIQGRGREDEQRIQDKIDQYEKLNEISTDDVEQKADKVKVEETPETETVPVTEIEEIVTTQKIEDPTTKAPRETTEQVTLAEYDIIAESPYLPDIPEKLDDEIHGVHLAGYQEGPELKSTSGVDRTEQVLEKAPELNNRATVFPLGKPKPILPARPPFKPSNKQRAPSKPAAQEGSLFDFFSFWGSKDDKKPRRPTGPQPPLPPPPPPRPVKEQTGEGLPVRPDTAVQPSISSRIDSSISTDSKVNDVEAYIVLPTQELQPKPNQPPSVQIQPQRPLKPFSGPRLPPPPPRPRVPPPPPRPLPGLPRPPPASRKQVPFIPRRPQLPPKVPSQVSANTPSLKKPLDKLFKKTETLSPKVIAKLTSQTKVYEGKKPFDFRPNGSNEKPSQISSHLSSIMNFLFQTTPSPAPAPSLPSLVEDTEFANIVHGYKPSDKNTTESGNEEQEKKLPPTIPDSETKLKHTGSKEKIDIYEELDSLTAPVPDKPQNIKKFIKSKTPSKPLPPPPTFVQKKRPPVLRQNLKATTFNVPTTTTTSSTLPPIKSTTTASTTTTTSISSSTSTFPGPIQALVDEYQQKGHVVSQETYPQPVLMAIKKNFEHKKNIFEQFVTFNENDKRFIPNKEVISSDWSVDSLDSLESSDKILVYQTLPPPPPPSSSTASPPPLSKAATEESLRRNSGPTFPNERNAEGGFRPMLRPLHSPLLNQ